MKKLIIILVLSVASTQALASVKSQAKCYADLLGVSVPRIVITNDFPESGILGEYQKGVIYIRPSVGGTALAHEMRHHWQQLNGLMPSKLYFLFTAYEDRKHEIDAREWASRNWSRCSSRSRAAIKVVSSGCNARHKVVKGDTWYSLSVRYKKSAQWLSSKSGKVLRLGDKVCV